MADGIKKISENVIVDKRALIITDPNVPDNDAISIGALQTNPASNGLKMKIAKGIYSLLDAASVLLPNSITTILLKDKCVTEAKLGDKSVTEPKLADDAISTRTIIDSNVTEPKLGTDSVTSFKIKSLNVLNRHYANNSISNEKVEDNTLENVKLKDKTITNLKIANATIISDLIANKAIKNIHLDVNTVNNINLIDESVYGNKIKPKGVEQKHLANGAVNTINILNGAVTGEKIPDKNIKSNHLEEESVLNIHLGNLSVTNAKLATDSVGTVNYKDKSITRAKLAEDIISMVGDPVQYDQNNDVTLRKHLTVKGNIDTVGTITASKVYNATFMDIAEAYEPGEDLNVGDIVEIREDNKVYKCKEFSLAVVGVISDGYAACYGATEKELEEGLKVAVGLIGKVPVNVCCPVKPGDRILAGINGIGYVEPVKSINNQTNAPRTKYSYIGKAIEVTTEPGLAMCLIFPN